jgi:predicted Zn-dependent protease
MIGRRITISASRIFEYQSAVELDPSDAVLRLGYARVLRAARRNSDALTQTQQAVSLAPGYVTAYQQLGVALEEAGDKPLAAKAYAEFLSRAARTDAARAQVTRRLESLGKAP